MPQKMQDIVKFGKEVTRGTGVSPSLHLPFLGEGLSPVLTNNLGKVQASGTWPYDTANVPLGCTAALTFVPDINVDTIRTLLLMATKWADGVFPSLSIAHSRSGVGDALYTGCVASQLSMEYSRSGSPGAEAILQGSLNLECMKPEATGSVAAGTQANAGRFKIGAGTFTINGVSALQVLSYRRTLSIAHALGPPAADNKRIYLEDGAVEESVELTARFAAEAWSDLVLNATEHTAVMVHGTGTANETVTETLGSVQAESHQLNSAEGTVTEQITLKPAHTGSVAPTIWTFGTGIGADALNL